MKATHPKIAVIGSKGYLGSRLLKNLSLFFDNVKEVDKHNLSNLLNCLDECSVIIWCAGLSNHELGKKDPWLDMQLNAIDIIKAAYHLKAKHTLIHLSSTCIYGNSSGIVNEDSLVVPLEPQAYSKVYAEHMLDHIAKIRGFRLLHFRSSAVVGDKSVGEPLSFLEKILINDANKKITKVYGGKQRPCNFTPINDFLNCMQNLIKLNDWSCHKLNLATHQINFGKLASQFRINFIDSKILDSLKIENLYWNRLNLMHNSYTDTLNYLHELQNELKKRFTI